MLRVQTDPKADAIYIQLLDEPVGYTEELDENRVIDYTLNPGKPMGIGLLSVSEGVTISGLPESKAIKQILEGLGITIIQ